MPNSRSLDQLRNRLATEFTVASANRALVWGDPKSMHDALRDLKRSFGDDAVERPRRDVLVQAVREFWRRRKVANFQHLKYVCYGICVPVEAAQWRIIDRPEVFNALLSEVEKQGDTTHQFRRCYQGLLSGYFGFDKQAPSSKGANAQWLVLRGFLDRKLDPLLAHAAQRQRMPAWLNTLQGHRNLLKDDPCRRYADALQQGRGDELKQVFAGLGIESGSWVWDEALLAYVQAVADGVDSSFKKGLNGVLNLVNDRTEWRLPSSIALRATAITVARYADCAETPEHQELHDTCLTRIGDPETQQAAWDAHVQSERARLMVQAWLKKSLIRDFFKLLSSDGSAEQARLDYWLRWEPMITQMWFVLGGGAARNDTKAFKQLRARMAGRERWLDGAEHENNAFVMRIGPLLVIEFGVTNNACFVYEAKKFPTDLSRKRLDIDVHLKLRKPHYLERLAHTPGWQRRFDEKFRSYLGVLPGSKGVKESKGPTRIVGPAVSPRPPVVGVPYGGSPASQSNAGEYKIKFPEFRCTDEPLPKPAAGMAKKAEFGVSPGFKKELTPDVSKMLKVRCDELDVPWEDLRSKGGAFWIYLKDPNKFPFFVGLLQTYGFSFNHEHGYWLK